MKNEINVIYINKKKTSSDLINILSKLQRMGFTVDKNQAVNTKNDIFLNKGNATIRIKSTFSLDINERIYLSNIYPSRKYKVIDKDNDKASILIENGLMSLPNRKMINSIHVVENIRPNNILGRSMTMKRKSAFQFNDLFEMPCYELCLDDDNNKNNDNGKFSRFDVLYGTDRKIKNANGKLMFGNKRDTTLHLGLSEISIPENHKKGVLERPAWFESLLLGESPKKHFTVLNIEDTPYERFIELLKKKMDSRGNDILLFIHGFNVRFKDALMRTAQLGNDLCFKGAVTAFSWPSNGTIRGYNADMDTAKLSSMYLCDFIKKLINGDVNKLHIIAHSMGNVVLTEALQTLRNDVNFPYDKINQIILAAPDIAKDVFLNLILPAIKGKPRLTLYASDKDKALILAKTIRNNYIRLGEGGENIVVADDLDSIDASRVDTSLLGHGYFAETQSLIYDIHMVLSGLLPDNRPLIKKSKIINGQQKPYFQFQRS